MSTGFPAGRKWGILALLMVLSASQQFHRISLPAVNSRIMETYSITEKNFGILATVFLVTYTLLMTPGGWLADRIGTWWTLLLVICGSGVFEAMTGMVGWFTFGSIGAWWWIAIARGCMGVCSAPLYPSTARTVGWWFPPGQQVLANSLVIGASLLGISVTYPAMDHLSRGIGWQSAFLVAGGATSIVVLLWVAAGRPRPAGEPTGAAAAGAAPGIAPMASLAPFLRHRGILALTLSYATVGYFEYLFFYWLNYYFENVLGMSKSESAFYAALPTLTMMVLTPLGGAFCGILAWRWGQARGLRRLAMAAMILAAAFLALGAFLKALPWKIGALSLALGCIGASEGPFWTAAVRLGGPYGATCGGFVNTGGNFLGALAPVATPWIAAVANELRWGKSPGDPLFGWTVALLAGSALCLAGALLWLHIDAGRPLGEEA